MITFYYFRSTQNTCNLIHQLCYSTHQRLVAVNHVSNEDLHNRFIQASPFLQRMFEKNKYNIAFASVQGETRTLNDHSTFNLEEASAVVYVLQQFLQMTLIIEDSAALKQFSVGVVAIHESMELLLIEAASRACCAIFEENDDRFSSYNSQFTASTNTSAKNKWIPVWLDILTVRRIQGSTYQYVVLPLIQSALSDCFASGGLNRGFVEQPDQFLVSISRQRSGLIVLMNTYRFVRSVTSLFGELALAAPSTTLVDVDPRLGCQLAALLAWCIRNGNMTDFYNYCL